MITFYQRRATGKSTNLVSWSHSTGIPIATRTKAQADHLQWIADNVLKVTIPKPFVASKEACKEAGKYMVDEAGLVLQKILGGEVVAMTVTDDGDAEFDRLYDERKKDAKL